MSDVDESDAPSRGTVRVRPRAAGRAALRSVLAHLTWTDAPLVYWTGRPVPDAPAAAAVQRRLAGRPAGAYAVRLAAVTDRPTRGRESTLLNGLADVIVAEPVPVTSAVVVRAARSLVRSADFPRLLPAAVGDVAAWRATQDAAVARARAVLDAAGRPDRLPAACLVLGGGVVVGRSRHPLGWPADVLAEAERRVGPARLLRLARAVSDAADDVARAVRGRLLFAPHTLADFLDRLPEWVALHARLADEPTRRLRAAVAIQGESVAAAVGPAAGPIRLGNGPTDRLDGPFVRRVHADHLRHVDAAVGRYYSAVLTGDVPSTHPPKQRPRSEWTAEYVIGLLNELFGAAALRRVMLNRSEAVPARSRVRHARPDGRRTAVGPDGTPLTYDTLAAAAAAALWADVRGDPRPPPALSLVLDAAAVAALPPTVPWAFVEACCHVWPLGASDLGPAAAVLLSLAAAGQHAGAPPAAVAAALDRYAAAMLSTSVGDVTRLGSYRRHLLVSEAGAVGRYVAAGLTVDDLQPFHDLDGMDLLAAVATDRPGLLGPFARQMGGYLREWARAGPYGRWPAAATWGAGTHAVHGWGMAFELMGPAVVDQLVRGIPQPTEAAGVVCRLAWAMWDDAGPEDRRAARRAVVAGCVPTLVRRLRAAADPAARAAVTERFFRAFAAVDAAVAAGLPDGVVAGPLLTACFASPFVPAAGEHWFQSLQRPERAAVAALAMGRADRLIAVARLPLQGTGSASDGDADLFSAAWSLLAGLGVAEGVSAALTRAGLTGRVVRAVNRLGLCLRFHRRADLRAALADVAGVASDDPLAELARWRGEVPGRVREILDRPAALRRELGGLTATADLSAGGRRRADHLRRQLADPAAVAAWVNRDLARVVPAALDEARVARLEAVAEATIRGHFRDVLGVHLPADPSAAVGRNWDNALRLYLTIDRNRPRLRRLLRREARGDRGWMAIDARNAAFLRAAAAAGVDTAAWRGGLVRRATDDDGRPLRVELETDPLHVLQMGNYFGTCLSEGQSNAFSTVANATDANKRVAYVYDDRGTVVGRKLIAMTAAGQIVGFRTYGTADRLKPVLDAFCRHLARRCRATLHPAGRPDAAAVPDLHLSADWYDDGPEPFGTGRAARLETGTRPVVHLERHRRVGV